MEEFIEVSTEKLKEILSLALLSTACLMTCLLACIGAAGDRIVERAKLDNDEYMGRN